MKKLFLIIMFLGLSFSNFGQDKSEILEILKKQEKHWNDGDISNFMTYYWQSDSLKFISKEKITYGWQETKNRYFKAYPTKENMGTLNFEIKEIDFLSEKSAWVVGKWHLARPKIGDIGGYFTLIFKKINGKWLIVSDHTS